MSCPVCGADVLPRSNGPPATYCSPLCKGRAAHSRARASGAYQASYRKRLTQLKAETASRTATCVQCGKPYHQRRSDRLVCSAYCKGRRDYKARTLTDTEKERKRRRYARLKAQGYLPARQRRRRYILERDAYLCALCGEPTKRDVTVPHPLAPTVDHIMPIARGGTDDEHNLQCAHFRCNTRKAAKLLA